VRVISEAKLQGTLARARCRGTALFHVQVLIDFAAINCKRLVRHGEVQSGLAASSAPRRRANAEPADATGTSAHREPARARVWSFEVCLN
jgi:hypothetical protein